jgi:hypothetical protein
VERIFILPARSNRQKEEAAMVTQQECIDACMECAKVSDMCAAACLGERDLDALRRCLILTLDCADVCTSAARMMARDSDNEPSICRACAEICERCEEECRKHEDLEHCRICADVCARCAELCHAMAGSAAMA